MVDIIVAQPWTISDGKGALLRIPLSYRNFSRKAVRSDGKLQLRNAQTLENPTILLSIVAVGKLWHRWHITGVDILPLFPPLHAS